MTSTLPSVLYHTGHTLTGTPLVGGVWKLWEQEGFPLEMSHLLCRDNEFAVDWLEAMADASRTNNLPALMDKMEEFLGGEVVDALKSGWMRELKAGKSPEQILAEKQKNGRAFSDSLKL